MFICYELSLQIHPLMTSLGVIFSDVTKLPPEKTRRHYIIIFTLVLNSTPYDG